MILLTATEETVEVNGVREEENRKGRNYCTQITEDGTEKKILSLIAPNTEEVK